MGFGFNLLFVFIILPLTALLTIILLATWLKTKQKIYGKVVALMWLLIMGFIASLIGIKWLTSKTELDKKDYYGHYIVNRDYFAGKQADWQYDHFRFEIKDNDSIYFHVTDKEKIITTYTGKITTTKAYSSERLIINMEQPTHHIMTSNPTTYRSARIFVLIFYSPEFNNVYFKKGYWKRIGK